MEYQIKKPNYIKSKRRLGCGNSSGLGKTSGRGQKGQGSRSGVSLGAGFEGGQMPLQRRLPKRGFNNFIFRNEYQIVNIDQLDKIKESVITPDVLKKHRLINDPTKLVKLLGNGVINKSVTITVDKISENAKTIIEKANGKIIIRK